MSLVTAFMALKQMCFMYYNIKWHDTFILALSGDGLRPALGDGSRCQCITDTRMPGY